MKYLIYNYSILANAILLASLVVAKIQFVPISNDQLLKMAGDKLKFAIDTKYLEDGDIPDSGLTIGLFKYNRFLSDSMVAKVHLPKERTTGQFVLPKNAKSGQYILKASGKGRMFYLFRKAKSDKFKVLSMGNQVGRFSSFRRIKAVNVDDQSNTINIAIAPGLKEKDAKKLMALVRYASNGAIKQTFKNIANGKEESLSLSLVSFRSDIYVEIYAGKRLVYRSPRFQAPANTKPHDKTSDTKEPTKAVHANSEHRDNSSEKEECVDCRDCKYTACSQSGSISEFETCAIENCASCEECSRIVNAMVSGIFEKQIDEESQKIVHDMVSTSIKNIVHNNNREVPIEAPVTPPVRASSEPRINSFFLAEIDGSNSKADVLVKVEPEIVDEDSDDKDAPLASSVPILLSGLQRPALERPFWEQSPFENSELDALVDEAPLKNNDLTDYMKQEEVKCEQCSNHSSKCKDCRKAANKPYSDIFDDFLS